MVFKKGRTPWNKGKELTEKHRVNMSKARKEFYRNNHHPRGMLGKTNKWGNHTEEIKILIGKKMKGKRMGEKNPAWLGGKSFEPYDKFFNIKFKRAIRKRDNQVCMLCGIHREKVKVAFDVHHIDYDKKLSIPQNCISLCNSCHSKTGFNRKHWTQFFQSLLSEKYNYQYSENQEVIVEVKNGRI